jgi:hypothetical protein
MYFLKGDPQNQEMVGNSQNVGFKNDSQNSDNQEFLGNKMQR